MAEILVSIEVICEILDGVSPRRVQQLAKNGVISKAARGQYDLIACARALIDDAQSANSRAGVLYEQRARLVRLQADRVEMENSTRAGELVNVEEYSAGYLREIMNVRTNLLAIPTKVAPLAAHKSPSEVFTVVKNHLYEAMHAIADDLENRARKDPNMLSKNPTIEEISEFHNVPAQWVKRAAAWLEIPIINGRISNVREGFQSPADKATAFGRLIEAFCRGLDPRTEENR